MKPLKPPKTEEGAAPRPRGSALARAIGLLSRREHSAVELRSKLIQRGFPADEVDAALTRLQSSGLQDDARFAESLVRSRANAGRGPQRLRFELSQHGLDPQQAEHAMQLAEADADWLQRALELARRRFPAGASEPKDRRRLADLLLRRGYSMDVMRAVLGRLQNGGADGAAEDEFDPGSD